MGSILISHPHAAAVAQGFAASLARRGKLAAFATGVAFGESGWQGRIATTLALRRPVLSNRILADVPAELIMSFPLVELGGRGVGWLLKQVGASIKAYDVIFAAHDAAVASVPWPAHTTGVYAYEDAALQTFRRARRRGLARIWDLPLPHYAAIERIHQEEAKRWPDALVGPPVREPEWKRRRKDGELALATQISVASTFTKRSLQDLAVDVDVVTIPYGFPVEEFSPRPHPPTGPFRVLSVGTHDLRKGTPYLLEAWRCAAIPDAELHLVGPLRLAKPFLDQYAGTFHHVPHVPKAQLEEHYARADLLAFPTLGDGFGLVMQEAMCCGTPVVTTPCGGGPECITDGIDGWVVPARSIEALVEILRWAASNRDTAAAVGSAARARAESWPWQRADDMLVKAFAS